MTISHATPSTASDGAVPGYIQPSHWNAAHTVDLTNEYTSAVHIDLRRTCTGDGVANDTGAMSAQIAAAVALSPSVSIYVAPGKTFLTDMFTHSTAATTLLFYGGGTIKLRTTSVALLRCAHATAQMILTGIKLDGGNVALTDATSALALCSAGKLILNNHTEILNAGVNLSGISCGISSYGGGQLDVEQVYLHEINGYAIRASGTGKARLAGGTIKNCGASAIYVDNAGGTGVVSDGCTIDGWIIDTCRNDLAGTGEYGNGIHIYNVAGVSIGAANVIRNTAYSFIRIAGADAYNISVNGGVGTNSGETGFFIELGAHRVTVTGFVCEGTQNYGMSCTNLPGASHVIFNACEVYDFGKSGLPSAGIACEFGQVIGCTVDGANNVGATWGIATAPAAFTGDWRSRFDSNQTAGCKYDVGVAFYMTGGAQQTTLSRNSNFRQDANYVGPIGTIGGGASDNGNGSLVDPVMYGVYTWDGNYWNVPTAHAPTTGVVGSRMKINGAWYIADGVGWRAEVTSSVETITYSTSMTPTFVTMNRVATITANNTTAFTINAVSGTPLTGALLTFVIRNTSGGVHGNITWNAVYKTAAWVKPATGFSRSITFQYNGTNWVEITRGAADIPN